METQLSAEQKALVRVLFKREISGEPQLRSFANIARNYLASNDLPEGLDKLTPSRVGVELCLAAGIALSPGILTGKRGRA